MIDVQCSQLFQIINSLRNWTRQFVEIQIDNQELLELPDFRWDHSRKELEGVIALVVFYGISTFEVKESQPIQLFYFVWDGSTDVVRL